MKKIWLVLFLLVIVQSAYAVTRTPVKTVLNATTYTAIVIPEKNGRCRPIAAWSETQVGWYIAVDASGTGESLIPAPGTYSEGCVNYDGGLVFYAKAVSGTPTLVLKFGMNP